MQGVPVRGTISDIPELVRKYHILEIVIAITTVKGDRLSEIINLCNSTHCRVRMISDPQAVDENGNPVAAGFRELNTADFLSRDEIQLNNAQISEYLHDKIVLVTGGGGSIGSELCRQIMRYQPRRLLIFDIYENCAYELETELKNKYGPEAPVITLIGSIRDKARLDDVFDTYHPSVVFHAAAHKHVPLMEISPAEAVKNNVFGTKNLLTSAAEHGVERFVQLSTDKAVNPTNVMGCTKRLCEMLIQTFSRATSMTCVAVRFGNVLGSHGSVIPLFEEQIKRGGPVTITHPDIVRYFMTITEAAQLVLQAGGLAKGGSIYVLDMGEPVKIMDLANRLIRFYGYEPGVNMQVKVTGLRPGEKLYEELLMDSEQDKMAKTAHNKIFIAPPMQIDLENSTPTCSGSRTLPCTTATRSSTFCRRWSRPTTPTAACAPTTPLWPPPATPRFSPGRRLHRSSGRQSIPPRRADLCTSVTASACWTLSFHWQPRSFLQFRWGWSRCGSSSIPQGRSFSSSAASARAKRTLTS